MKALVLRLDGTKETARRALGTVVCANVRLAEGKRLALRKGQTVTESQLPALEALHGVDLSLLVPEPGDMHEDEAAMRLGRAAAGVGVGVAGPSEARTRLVAEHKGL